MTGVIATENLSWMPFVISAGEREFVFEPVSRCVLTILSSVWAKLAELGLGDEEPLLNSYDKDRLENLEGMKEPTVLTERSASQVFSGDIY